MRAVTLGTLVILLAAGCGDSDDRRLGPDGGGSSVDASSMAETARPEAASADGRTDPAPQDQAADVGADRADDLRSLDVSGPDVSARDGALSDARVADAGAVEAPGADPEPGRLAGITRLHNQTRAEIPVPPLVWDGPLAATAQAYADRCEYRHSGPAGLGENLAAFAPPGNRGASASVAGWASEKAFYDHAANFCASGRQCGHYTQMVWKTTTRLGCGVKVCDRNSPFPGFPSWELWVCNYTPPGNVNGQRPY